MFTWTLGRLKVSFRMRYPLLFVGVALLIGQLAAYLWLANHSLWIMPCCMGLILIFTVPNKRSSVLACVAFTAGALLLLQCIGRHPLRARGEYRVLMKVVVTPERKRPDEVTFGAVILDGPLTGRMLRCRSPELPWLQIRGVRGGDSMYAFLKYDTFPEHFHAWSYVGLLVRRGYEGFCRIKAVVPLWEEDRLPTWLEQLRTTLPDDHPYRLQYGLLLSLLLGIDSELPPQLEHSFKKAGLTHLLVFSGAQTTILYLLFGFLFRGLGALCLRYTPYRSWFLALQSIALVATVLIVWSIGFQLSSVRALLACWLVVLGERFESNRGMLYRMFLSLVLLNVIWPLCFLEVGVQLTYAALLGIWFGMRFQKGWRGYMAMSIAISVLTNLVTLCWFRSLSVMGFLLNPICAPLVGFGSIYLGIPALVGLFFNVPLLKEAALLVLMLIDYLESLVHWASQHQWGYYQW